MGFLPSAKKTKVVTQAPALEEEKESAAKKQRLLETEGANSGSELKTNQGKSIRKVFSA